MSEIKEQDRKKDQEGQAAIKRLSKPIKVRILLAQIFTILSALLSFVPYLALVWLGDIFLSAQTTGEQISAVQVHKVVNLLVMAFLSKLFFHALSLIITHFADMKLRFIIRQRIVERLSHIAEVGIHEKLLAKNGAYKEFWDKRNASSQWKLA